MLFQEEPEKKYSLLSAMVSTAIIAFEGSLTLLPAVAVIAGISFATYVMITVGKYLIELGLHIKNVVTNLDKTVENVNARVEEAKSTLKEVNNVIKKTGKTVATVEGEIKPLTKRSQKVLVATEKAIESANKEMGAISGKVQKTVKGTTQTIKEMKKTVSTLTPEVKNTLGHVNDTVDGINPVNLTSRAVGAAGSGLSNLSHTLLSYLPFYGASTTQPAVAPQTLAVVPRIPRSKQPKRK